MDKKKKIIISIVICVLLLILLFVVLGLTNDKKIIINDNDGVVSRKVVSNIVFDDIDYVYDGEKTSVSITIVNQNEQSVKIGVFTAKIYDKGGNLINTFVPVCNDVLSYNEEKKVEFFIKSDLSYAYNMEIELPNLEFLED